MLEMGVRFSMSVLDAVRDAARAASPRECCGLLLSKKPGETVDAIVEARNLADNPERRFEVDPATLLAAHRASRAGGPAIVGCYHSHPSGPPAPSLTDAAMADPTLPLWLICGGADQALRLWRIGSHDGTHARFDPVEMLVD